MTSLTTLPRGLPAGTADTHFTMCWSVTTVDTETPVMMQDVLTKEESVEVGVLDTGCISIVGPKKWMNPRLKTMSKKSRDMVTVKPSGRIFRFEGGVTAKSLGLYTVPVFMAGKNTFLNVDIVEAPIPLLISKAAMKKAGARHLRGQSSENFKNIMVEILSVWAEDKEEKMKQIKKVHEQMVIPTSRYFVE